MSIIKNEIGNKYGLLTVIARAPNSKEGARQMDMLVRMWQSNRCCWCDLEKWRNAILWMSTKEKDF
jgi:hypothetical protein